MTLRGVVLGLLVAVSAVACEHKVDNAQYVDRLRTLTGSTPAWVGRDALSQKLWKIERGFYTTRGFLPAWVDGNRTTPQWKDLVQQLKYSERHGLDPAKYHVAEFEQLREQSQTKTGGTRFPVERVPEMDARMTFAYLTYAADLLGWDTNPKAIYTNWIAPAKQVDLASRLNDGVAKGSVRESLESLAPTHQQYKGLQAALAAETQHPTGHADQIRMNMERWRWAPHDLGERYVLINVPAYQMQVMEGNTPVLAMRVIVGKPDWPTPLFSDKMTYIVFSPYWNIPANILKEEALPHLAKDPDWLRRNNMEVVGTSGQVVDASAIDWSDDDVVHTVRLRQAPGPENALGRVKFIFPNNFSVYLHDTNTTKLFDKDRRALSHGCIRVQDPVDLAHYVMRDRPEWTAERISTAMNAHEEQTVKLKEPIPVHIGYWTAWVEPDGKTVTYTDDPYGIDARQRQLEQDGRTTPLRPTGAARP
ncbi:MAG TPA: L,D-transpeptidase family protein [Vicinamibacterales bacterium]|nr:L,D-transpeptidase family protein [Vicinamibacterales bacterium]